MADEINPTLRGELNAALGVIAPQLRGEQDLTRIGVSPDLEVDLAASIVDKQRRHDLIVAVLATLDNAQAALGALEADGYPALPLVPMPNSLLAELNEKMADISSAVSVFGPPETGDFNPQAKPGVAAKKEKETAP